MQVRVPTPRLGASAPLSAAVLFLLILLGAPGIHAQRVDREELEKSRSARIVFINYEGPHSRIESREDIRGIGLALGRAIRAGALRAGSANRYFAVHSVEPGDGDRLNADILGLGVDVGVDHIRNLRLILQGYLEGAYEYSAEDASLLAEFITVYNAAYRGSWGYFSGRYREGVVKELNPEKAGLSIRFDEWPGRALILIPLATARAGSLSAVDTGAVTEKAVIDQMRREEDRGLDQRKDMVDLKEREAEGERQSAALQREAIMEEEARLAADRSALEAERAQVAEERRAADAEAARRRAENPAPAAGAASAAAPARTPAQERAAEREAELTEREEGLAASEANLAERRVEAAATEARAEQKEAEAKVDRASIAQDQQAVIAAQDAAKAVPAGIHGVRLTGPLSPLGRLVLVDGATGRELAASTLNTLNGRTVTVLGDRIIAVAGQAVGTGAIRLVLIDPKSLEMAKQGSDDIHPSSLLWITGQEIYALAAAEGKAYLARFDTDLVRRARSAVPVHPFASVAVREGVLLTQREDGSALVLNPSDLVERR